MSRHDDEPSGPDRDDGPDPDLCPHCGEDSQVCKLTDCTGNLFGREILARAAAALEAEQEAHPPRACGHVEPCGCYGKAAGPFPLSCFCGRFLTAKGACPGRTS